MKTRLNHQVSFGFSLVEMAVVLVIFGFLVGALLLPLQVQRSQFAKSQTENTLEIAKRALIGYAQSQGRLPCPAITTSSGLESPIPVTGACTSPSGFLPAATLGIQPTDANGFAIDGWDNPVRYAVTTVNTAGGAGTPDFTTSNEMSNVGISTLSPNLTVCSESTNCSATSYLTKNAVAVIFSTGENFGKSAGIDEAANLAASTTFYSRTPMAATDPPATSKEFDDMVVWISPYILYNAMIEAGQLH